MGIFRFFLALDIIFIHCGVPVIGANWIVEIFYILSGFYMTMVLNTKYKGKGSYFHFIKNCFMRILPVLWIVSILSLLLSLSLNVTQNDSIVFNTVKLSSNNSIFTLVLAFLVNLLGVGQDWTLYFAVNPNSGNL